MKELKWEMSTLAEVQARLNLDERVAFDLETRGFYGEVLLAQFYQQGWEAALLVQKPEIMELASLTKKMKIVCHNTGYEVSALQTQLGAMLDLPNYAIVPGEWDDTLLLAKLQYYTKEKYALDDCYKHAFRADPYAMHNLDKKAMQTCDWSILTDDKCKYAAIDVFYLLDLFETCQTWCMSSNYQLDHAATTQAFGFQTNGLHFNPYRIKILLAKHQARIAELGVPINVNSWQQVRLYIDEAESDGLALATFALEGNKRAGEVNETRKLLKQIGFLEKYLRESYENRIYGKFSFTTKSGRGNCKDQNLQQLPRKTKEVFEAEKGNVLVMSDFAQLELRYGCAFTGESVMEGLFRKGTDLHQYVADMMGVNRQYAKTCNFNLLYGGSASMLRSIFIKDCDILLPIGKVSAMKKHWHKLWPTLTQWQEDTTSDWRNGIAQETLLGRKFKSKLYTDAMNLPIQGGSAEIAKLAMHKMFKTLADSPELQAVAKFCNFVHDSFIWECPDDSAYYEPLAKLTADAMKEAWEELVLYTKIPDLPMPVDVIVGKNWGDLEYGIEEPKYKLVV